MNQDKSQVIASSLGVPQRSVELLVDCGLFTEDEVEPFIRRGIETGQIKTVADYELEFLFGIYGTKEGER